MAESDLLETLERLLALSREAGTVEFKSNWDQPADIAEYLSALGNSAAPPRANMT